MTKKIVIAISGPPGAGSTSIAREVAKKLKLKYFCIGKIQKKFGKTKKEAAASLEVWKTELGKSEKFHKNVLDKTQIEKAKEGNIVISAKLSIFMLKNLADYKIWLDTSLKVRARRTAMRDKIPVERALKEIIKREKIEREIWKKIYGFDYFDQKYSADFVLDNSKLTLKQAVNKILEFIEREEKKKKLQSNI